MTKPMINLSSDWGQMMRDHEALCSLAHPGPMNADAMGRVRRLLSRIAYKDWTFHLVDERGQGILQLCTVVPDSKTGLPLTTNGRPLAMCNEMDDGFIVDLAFELVKEFELHEAAETFRVDGTDIYYPHRPNGRPVFTVGALRGQPLSPLTAERPS